MSRERDLLPKERPGACGDPSGARHRGQPQPHGHTDRQTGRQTCSCPGRAGRHRLAEGVGCAGSGMCSALMRPGCCCCRGAWGGCAVPALFWGSLVGRGSPLQAQPCLVFPGYLYVQVFSSKLIFLHLLLLSLIKTFWIIPLHAEHSLQLGTNSVSTAGLTRCTRF